MLPPIQATLDGFDECAALVLRALLMPDGSVSHYEIEGRRPDGSLSYFSARSDGDIPLDPDKLDGVIMEFRQVLSSQPRHLR